ncbi:MAG: SUMF1/EgtB/PvdO family nonheme iron enzyme, partial [Candidatus Marinimicrobia bacterium]|nr:SUMF1/EgtB/PvdO family nonheme iron enzyme [Candidatus Neomarinimicrobiota bacterium]
MVYVEGGTFQMGSNSGISDQKPVHTVTVKSFYIDQTEVTQAE